MSGTIHADVQSNDMAGADTDPDFNAFLDNLSDDPKRSTATESEEAPETETAAAQEPETTQGEEPTTEADPDDPDDYEVEIKVGEETKTATIRDLKRLYGQEASLTQKSQALADKARTAEAQSTAATTALRTLLERAQARYKPYSDLDPMILMRELDAETFAAYRKEEAAAKADVDFLTTELHSTIQAEQHRSQQAFAEAAKVCVDVLSNEETGIKGWSRDLYNGLMTYADEHGVKNARSLVDPAAIKLLHKAYLYDQGQKAATDAAAKAAKAKSAATRVLRPGAARQKTNDQDFSSAVSRLRNTNQDDDAVSAFMKSFDR